MRQRLRGLRWAVSGALLAGLVLAATGGAADGQALVIGQTNNGTNTTRLLCSPGMIGPATCFHGESNNGTGLAGMSTGGGGSVAGVYGSSSTGFGLLGVGNIGLVSVGTALAGYFSGNVHVQGTLSKSAGSFRIDHPLDRTKYLQHSFVESPDMMNVYNGNVRTDRRGFATVRLPRYFQALNRDFRYQLTIVGTRGWRARVVRRIHANRFTIQTDVPRALVSWQVTGVRHDAYANAHRIQPEIAKSADRGATAVSPQLVRRLRTAR